jgi:hypothetical protein
VLGEPAGREHGVEARVHRGQQLGAGHRRHHVFGLSGVGPSAGGAHRRANGRDEASEQRNIQTQPQKAGTELRGRRRERPAVEGIASAGYAAAGPMRLVGVRRRQRHEQGSQPLRRPRAPHGTRERERVGPRVHGERALRQIATKRRLGLLEDGASERVL